MILSVLRNTKDTVKFWFIENFLSPSFLVRPLVVSISLWLIRPSRNSSLTSPPSTTSNMNWSPTNGRRGCAHKKRSNAPSGDTRSSSLTFFSRCLSRRSSSSTPIKLYARTYANLSISTFMVHHTRTRQWATTTRIWKVSGFGRRDIGKISLGR